MAATHNGISRYTNPLANAGADTGENERSMRRTIPHLVSPEPAAAESEMVAAQQQHYQQTALLTTLYYFSNNTKLFLKNFYVKSKRSIEKPKREGPAAYVFPGDDPRLGSQADLLRLLQAQGCEIHRATADFTVTIKAKKKPAAPAASPSPAALPASSPATPGPAAAETPSDAAPKASASPSPAATGAAPTASPSKAKETSPKKETEERAFPAGSYIVRMDQPTAGSPTRA